MTVPEKIEQLFPSESEIPSAYFMGAPIEQREYLIDGIIRTWDGPNEIVHSPICIHKDGTAERKIIGSYPLLTETEALEALDAAFKAYDNGRGLWPTMSVETRIQHMEMFLKSMIAKRDEVVKLLIWEIGKNYPDSLKEFDRTVLYIRDTIDALKELDRNSSRFVIEQDIFAQIRRAPLGVVLCMGPFNYPLNETFTTLIPALIMGNTVIFKPPKLGVLLHQPLLESFRSSFPPGAVNTVYGEGQKIIGPLMTSGKIDSLAFIGTSRVANLLKHQHPKPHRMRCVLGLEAKNVGIVLPDADLDMALEETILGTLSFNGQRCTALKIMFVHSRILDDFLIRLSEAVDAIPFGMPWEEGVKITPLPEENKTEYLRGLVDDARREGAKVVNKYGGMINNTFFYPAILCPVNERMRVYHEEQFGPVIPVCVYDNISAPLDYIVNSQYGQQVSIFGKDPELIAELIDPLVNQVCRVNINSQCQRGPDTFPFTGRKDSAEGTLSVSDALRVFSIRTLVAAKSSDLNKGIITDIVTERRSNFLSTDFIL